MTITIPPCGVAPLFPPLRRGLGGGCHCERSAKAQVRQSTNKRTKTLFVVILSVAKYLKIKRDISPLAQYDKNAVIASICKMRNNS